MSLVLLRCNVWKICIKTENTRKFLKKYLPCLRGIHINYHTIHTITSKNKFGIKFVSTHIVRCFPVAFNHCFKTSACAKMPFYCHTSKIWLMGDDARMCSSKGHQTLRLIVYIGLNTIHVHCYSSVVIFSIITTIHATGIGINY